MADTANRTTSKTIYAIDWPVVDIFIDFPASLRDQMAAIDELSGKPKFETLTLQVLRQYFRFAAPPIPGSTMTNMLATVAGLGGKAAMIGITGHTDDQYGIIARTNMRERGIDLMVEPQPMVKPQDALVAPVIYYMKDADGEAIYNPIAHSARKGLTADMILKAVTDPANAIICTQNIFISHGDIKPEVHDAIRTLQSQGAQLALGLQCVPENCPPPLFAADYMFGNQKEYANLLNCDKDAKAIRTALLDRSSDHPKQTCVVTFGEHGLMQVKGRTSLAQYAAPIDQIVCNVGAGDAAMGGYLQAAAMGLPAVKSLKLAALTAREALQHQGGQPPTRTPGHLRHLLETPLPA